MMPPTYCIDLDDVDGRLVVVAEDHLALNARSPVVNAATERAMGSSSKIEWHGVEIVRCRRSAAPRSDSSLHARRGLRSGECRRVRAARRRAGAGSVRVLSGPSCGKALVDLGADVIKVEPPEGDLTRTAQPRVGGLPGVLRAAELREAVRLGRSATRRRARHRGRLAAASDVVLENFRPGVLDRLGLGYAAVRARNPRVVYCSITGYGQDGPMAGRRAYAPVMHAELGLMEFAAAPAARRAARRGGVARRPVRGRCRRRSASSPRSCSASARARASTSTCRWPR